MVIEAVGVATPSVSLILLHQLYRSPCYGTCLARVGAVNQKADTDEISAGKTVRKADLWIHATPELPDPGL